MYLSGWISFSGFYDFQERRECNSVTQLTEKLHKVLRHSLSGWRRFGAERLLNRLICRFWQGERVGKRGFLGFKTETTLLTTECTEAHTRQQVLQVGMWVCRLFLDYLSNLSCSRPQGLKVPTELVKLTMTLTNRLLTEPPLSWW